jgi:hypothetical protein
MEDLMTVVKEANEKIPAFDRDLLLRRLIFKRI